MDRTTDTELEALLATTAVVEKNEVWLNTLLLPWTADVAIDETNKLVEDI